MSTFRLFRFGPAGQERPAVEFADGRRLDCSSFGEDWGPRFFANDGLARLAPWLAGKATSLPAVPAGARFGPCVQRPGKLICIGLNYKDHARETKATIPAEPVLFFKATTAITGPNDGLVIPKDSQKTDWEVELLVVIGKTAQYLGADDAMAHVAGYALHNDYSERHWQLERGGQWVKGKSFDTFAPIGPYFVPAAQVREPQNLHLWLKVNGRMRQDSNTREMVFGVAELIRYLSHCMTLEPGDCITTGTPAGVGLGCTPPEYIKPGDVIELGIDGFGSQRQVATAWESTR
ncbi:MAG: fumarylacetoacetate hydrolase family protein [Planctomycetes bacterium]|nr:fumarylacetoacetate hydrolase family protein [Planctomycetota bacterium]